MGKSSVGKVSGGKVFAGRSFRWERRSVGKLPVGAGLPEVHVFVVLFATWRRAPYGPARCPGVSGGEVSSGKSFRWEGFRWERLPVGKVPEARASSGKASTGQCF